MMINNSVKNKKDLNRISSENRLMKRGIVHSELKGDKLIKAIKEAQKDPEFIREINKFIKAATTIHKLN